MADAAGTNTETVVGNASNATSIAPTTANVQGLSFLYGWNAGTWQQINSDGSGNLKVAGNFTATLGGTTAVNLVQVAGSSFSLGQKVMASSLPVAIATDQGPIPVTIGGAATTAVNIVQFGGTAVTLGQAVMATSLPVAIASNQSAVPVSASQRWIGGKGQGLTWGNAFSTADLSAIVSGNAIISTIAIDNSTTLDVLCDISVSLGTLTSTSGAPYIGFYLYPLLANGTTYGDNRFGTSTTGPPPSQYFVGASPVIASTSSPMFGIVRGISLPPGGFKFVAYNLTGGTLSSTNTVQFRTYNLSLA